MRLTPRLVRRGLLAVLVLVSGAVALSLRHPGPSSPAASAGHGDQPRGTTLDQMVLVQFGEGEARRTIKARHVAGSDRAAQLLEGVEATLPYLEQGKPGTLTVRADRCRYTPQPLRAEFRGHVEVRSTTGLELDSEALDYRSSPEEGRTDELVRFKHGNLSGSARGASFHPDSGVELRSEVKLLLTSPTALPTTIEAGRGQASRADGRVHFEGNVHVRQGNRDLRCGKLQLNMVDEFKTIQRAVALDDVDLRVGPGAGVGTVGPQEAERRLRCRKLSIDFAEDGRPQEAAANIGAVLEISPDSPSGEKRRVEAGVINFGFDEQGRMTWLDARPGAEGRRRRRRREQQPATVVTSVSPTVQRRLECRRLHVGLDPESGAVQDADVVRDIVFAEPGRKAWAQHAVFRDGPGLLTLTGDPRLVDEEQGSDLRAQKIELLTHTHGVTADENVRHTITRKSGKPGPGPIGSGEEPTVLLCRHFEYDSATGTARYRENALMRSGRDELRAPLLVLEEPAEGRRRLTASDGVVSLLHPRTEKGQKKEPAPVETRSKQMVYDEKERRVVYTGDVEIRQGDMLTKSPEAVVLLTPDGGAVDRMLAGTPVEVRQGTRQARGDRGTYTPRDETLVLVGDKVVLQEAGRRLEGRILTFQSGSDRIRVDGREEVRTEAVLKRQEPPKP